MDAYNSLLKAFDRLVQKWDEALHPRDEHGRFAESGTVGNEPQVAGASPFLNPREGPLAAERNLVDDSILEKYRGRSSQYATPAQARTFNENIDKLNELGVKVAPFSSIPYPVNIEPATMVAHIVKQVEAATWVKENAPGLFEPLTTHTSLAVTPNREGNGSYHSGNNKLIVMGAPPPEGWADKVGDSVAFRDGKPTPHRSAEAASWQSQGYYPPALVHELAHAVDYNQKTPDGRPYGVSREFNKVLLAASRAEGTVTGRGLKVTPVVDATGNKIGEMGSWVDKEFKKTSVDQWCEQKLGPYANKVYTTMSRQWYGKKSVRADTKGLRVERWSMAVTVYLGPDYKPGWFPREVEEFIEKKTGFRRKQVQKYDSILKGDVPGHPFRGNQYVPGEPGSTPIKPGFVRLFHQTSLENASSIRENGLLLSKAQGIEGPRAIYAAEKPFYGNPGGLALVEIQIPQKDFLAPYFVTGGHREKVPPEEIIAVHEPWHSHVRYFEEPGNEELLQRVVAGEEDSLIPADPTYGPAIAYVKAKYGNKQPVKKAAGPTPVPYGSRDIPTACCYCAHLTPGYVGIGTSMDTVAACCKAFPDGISSLVYRGDSHLSPIPGDRGVLFKLADGAPLPPWMKQ